MSFSLSPAVTVNEKDLTTSITAAATNASSVVGKFAWGPVLKRMLVTDQDEGTTALTYRFGKPDDNNFNDFFQAWNYLAYSKALFVVRVVDDTARNAADSGASTVVVKHYDDFVDKSATIQADGKKFIAKYPGTMGDKISVSVADVASFDSWANKDEFEYAPTGTQFAVLVKYDGVVKERFVVDRVSGDKDYQGLTTYFDERINRFSEYVWIVAGHATSLVHKTGDSWDAITATDFTFSGGVDGGEPTLAEYQAGADLFKDESVDIKTIIQTGGDSSSETYGKYVFENIAQFRKDTIAVVGPARTSVLGQIDPATREVAQRNNFGSSSYGFWSSNYKYQYDRYSDKYRWISFAGDVAGLMARAAEDEPWQTPAGYDFGKIKNVERVAYSQNKPQRDILYKAQCNPIFIDGADGCVLLGDKTLQVKQSAFQFYNVRSLFIVIEKAIATSAKYQLFKYNDDFTRLNFKNMLIPYLRNVQGRRGLIGFAVVCDGRNNTPYVIDQGQFKASILVKPNRTIQGVGLDFVATSTGVDFEEITNALFG